VLSRVSSTLRHRIQVGERKRAALLDRIKGDPLEEVLFVLAQLERFITGLAFVGLGFGFMWFSRWIAFDLPTSPAAAKPWAAPVASVAGPVFGILGPILALGGLIRVLTYLTQGRLLAEARRARNKADGGSEGSAI
jgi:hypothetical protein